MGLFRRRMEETNRLMGDVKYETQFADRIKAERKGCFRLSVLALIVLIIGIVIGYLLHG